MDKFVFENKTKVFFGEGCVREYLPELVKAYGETVMLVYGGGSIRRNGVYDQVMDCLHKAEKRVIEFSGISANPTYQKVLDLADLARKENASLILAVGGGSVMDCSKAAALAAVSREDIWEKYWAVPGVVDVDPLPLGVIVTAAGTGSECNGTAIITNEDKKVKTGRDYPKCNPRFALMDPVYTYSIPKMQMISGGFDVFSHIMEAYFSCPNEDNITDDISEALMRGVIRDLRIAVREPENYVARSNLFWASTMAENRMTKIGKKGDFECHQMEHQIGAYTDCNHGFGLAVLHPTYYRHIYKFGLPKFVKFADHVWQIPREDRSEEEYAASGVDALADFIKELELPSTLRELGIRAEEELEEIAYSCNISSGSYKKMTHEEILDIFKECF